MLYKKIEELQQATKKTEQNNMHHTMFLTRLLLSSEVTDSNNQGGESLHRMIKEHLLNISQNYNK